MNPFQIANQPFRFESSQQAQIHRLLLDLIGPGPAAFYRDACRLMSTHPLFDSTTHLVSHALREVESALRDVILSVSDQVELNTLRQQMQEQKHKAEILSILKGLEIDETESVAQAWLQLTERTKESGLERRAHRDSLSQPRSVDDAFQEFWEGMQIVLQSVLDRFEARYTSTLPLLDELLAKPVPTEGDLNRLKNQVPNNLITFEYFFSRLNNPSWLLPLKSNGFFRHPQPIIVDEDQGTYRVPPWPVSKYLVRMSEVAQQEPEKLDPDIILQVAFEIPVSHNARVEEDIAEVALALPPRLSVQLIERIKQGIVESFYQWMDFEKFALLAVQLAKADHKEPALDLMRTMLAVLPDPRTLEISDEAQVRHFTPQPQTRLRTYQYEEILKGHMPALVSAAGFDALDLLCDLLDNALHFSEHPQSQYKHEDYSHIWRFTIGKNDTESDDPHLSSHPLENMLISAIRDASVQLASDGSFQVLTLIQKLEARKWTIFRRLALYLVTKFAEQTPDSVILYLTNRSYFNDQGLQPEYNRLAKQSFAYLNPKQQTIILGWIEDGPPELADQSSDQSQSINQEEAARYMKRWHWKRLSWIATDLPANWKKRYEELVKEFGEFQPIDDSLFHKMVSDVDEPSSPKTAAELQEMPIELLVEYLWNWQPSDNGEDGTVAGLSSQLNKLVSQQASYFAVNTDHFVGLNPIYVRAVLQALYRVNKEEGITFSWSPVLKLCQWAVRQPLEAPKPSEIRRHHDDIWHGIRWIVNDLLSIGLESGLSEFPLDLRQEIWSVLLPLTEDPDPKDEQDVQFGDPNTDILHHAINTIRGRALGLVIRYALWISRNSKKEQVPDTEEANTEEVVQPNFLEMPEVRSVLVQHLDPEHDRSLAIRAVYGEWLPWLVSLDKEWVIQNVSRLFPSDQNLTSYRDAAWRTYVAYSPPYDNVFPIVQGEYVRAVEELNSTPHQKQRVDPDEGIAHHLMAFYWRNLLDLNSDGLITRFFEKASGPIRKHAIWSIGIMIGSDNTLSSEVQHRLMALWEWRVTKAQVAANPSYYAEELIAFGLWFASSKFDDSWSILQLKEVLSLTGGQVEHDSQVIERLAVLAASSPTLAIECLILMVNGVREDWRIHAWKNHLPAALTEILKSSDQYASTQGIYLINRLVARGYVNYQDLLPLRSKE